jgi:signal transduction histidine kinase
MRFRLRLLIVAFAVSFLLVGILSVISYLRFSKLAGRMQSVESSHLVVGQINTLEQCLAELDKAEFRFLLTHDSSYLQPFMPTVHRIRLIGDSIQAQLSGNGLQADRLVIFRSDLKLYLNALRSIWMTGKMPDSTSVMQVYRHNAEQLAKARETLESMAVAENRELKARTAERENYAQLTVSMTKALSLTFGLLTLVLFGMLMREFRQRIRYQGELQQRMMEIAQSKQELEQIAYATTHDLQEPLRKIQILADRWRHQQREDARPDEHHTSERLMAAARRMQELVGDLMILTTLNDGAAPVKTALSDSLGSASASLHEEINHAGAHLRVSELPEIKGHPDQLKLLFRNLLENALKFARPGVTPDIEIAARIAGADELDADVDTGRQFHCISIRDNGLGFDNKLADRMFGIFRQLHTGQEGFEGKGTGLAICQRIMSNHKGRIIAHGFPNAGATFKLYFPIQG